MAVLWCSSRITLASQSTSAQRIGLISHVLHPEGRRKNKARRKACALRDLTAIFGLGDVVVVAWGLPRLFWLNRPPCDALL
jgi:hypothetical protein